MNNRFFFENKRINAVIFYFILFVVFYDTNKIFSQVNVYHSFPDSSAHWNFESISSASGIQQYSIYVTNDTIIESSKTHKKLFSPNSNGIVDYVGAIREDSLNKQIFYIPVNDTVEQLLYDFNMQVGDTVKGYLSTINYPNPDTVISIDSVLMGDNYRKRWKINSCYNIFLIEGVGSTYGLVQPSPGCITDFTDFNLLCFRLNNKTLYPDTIQNCDLLTSFNNFNNEKLEHEKLYPNPVTDLLNIDLLNFPSQKQVTISLYNQMGEIVWQTVSENELTTFNFESLATGVYFLKLVCDDRIVLKKVIKD